MRTGVLVLIQGSQLQVFVSRPNITFVVHKLSQFLSQPRQPHLDAAHYLLQYIKASPGQGILFLLILLFSYEHLLKRIGVLVLIQGSQLQVFVFFLEIV